MSRAPQRHDRTAALALWLHLRVTQQDGTRSQHVDWWRIDLDRSPHVVRVPEFADVWPRPVYLSPSGLPAMRRRIASFRRLAFVSSCLADSIQPIYRRRCEGASPWKYRRAAGCFLNAAWMSRGTLAGIWNRGGRGP